MSGRCLGCGTVEPATRRVGHVVDGDAVIVHACVNCESTRIVEDELRDIRGGTRVEAAR